MESVCSRKKFFFNEWNSSVLKVDVNGSPPGRVIWASENSAEFFGYRDLDLKKKSINMLMTRRVSKLHNFFIDDCLKGAPSEKIFGTTGLVFKSGDGFLDRRFSTMKPFFMHTSVHIIYMLYAEYEQKSQISLISLDSKGFFEGITRQAGAMLGVTAPKMIASNLASVFFYFPALVDVFYLISEDFAQCFEPVANFSPRVAIDPCPDGPNSYFVSLELKPMPIKTVKLFELIVTSLIENGEKKLNFKDFQDQVYHFSELARATHLFNFKIQVTKCGFEHSFIKMEALSSDLIEFNEPTLKSSSNHDHGQSSTPQRKEAMVQMPRISIRLPEEAVCDDSESEDEEKEESVDSETNPLRHLGYLKIVGKSLHDEYENEDDDLKQSEAMASSKLENQDSIVSILNPPEDNLKKKRHAKLSNLGSSDSNNVDFKIDCKGDSEEEMKADYISARSEAQEVHENSAKKGSKSKGELFDMQNSSLASSDTSKLASIHDSFSEQLNDEMKRPHTTRNSLIVILFVPFVQFFLLFLFSQMSLSSNFDRIGAMNIQGYFYGMLVETSYCISLLLKLLSLRSANDSSGEISKLSKILNDDFNVFLSALYSESWKMNGTILEPILSNFDKFHLFALEASKAKEHLLSDTVDLYTNTTSYESILKTHKSLPDLYQTTPSFLSLFLPFLIVSGIALGVMLWMLIGKIR